MAPTNNFQQWNSTEANQETDAEYTGDAQRVGGAAINARFPSALANKLFYQVTIMMVALATFVNNQGFNTQDGNLAALVTSLTNAFLALGGSTAINVVAFSTTPVFDGSKGDSQEITLTNNVTSSTFINIRPNTIYKFIIFQDGIGARTFVWPTNLPSSPIIGAVANQATVISFFVNQAGAILNYTPAVLT